MKKKISLLILLLFSLCIIGCGGDNKDDGDDKDQPKPPVYTPGIDINTNMSIHAIENIGITNLDQLELTSLDDFIIETNEEYLTYIPGGYVYANKVGSTSIKVTSKHNSEVTSTVNIEISENTNKIPEFKMTNSHITIDSSMPLRLTNYSDLSLFEVILSDNNIIQIDDRNRINPINTGKVDIYLRLKDNHSCGNKYSLEIISMLPKLFVTKDTVLVNESTYLNVSNLDETFEKTIDEFTWTVDSDAATIENFTFKSSTPGIYTVTATSIHNPLVKSSCKITVVESTDNLILSVKEGYNGKAGKGDLFTLTLNNNYSFENITLVPSNEEILRVTSDGKVLVVNEGYATITAYEKGNASNKSLFRFYVDGIANVDYVERILTQALGEVGIVERQDENGNYVNDTKYNHWYNYDGAWCAMCVSWNWYHAGLSNDLLVKYMSCSAGMTWCIEQGIFHYKEDYTPKSGDIVFFMSAGMSHTGIVVYCDGDYIYTVEGNRSNCVDVWRITCNNATITGYASPHYPEYDGTPADFSWITGKDENGEYYWRPSGNQSTQ